ncbi:hypothetical protein PITC_072410 [Penicillium italicum]|uniref:Zn(2)-C6 fungal-type domain-containing protein n=1 Tax=Penicillium italicum TaxID=40296 RepID=A0A0A2KEC1_PENIT|nr:hypothetical protein PITC_072410 [Penicillium italicum]
MTTHQTAAAKAVPNRQSCDRCHGQKLRCTREGSGKTDPCVRCLRQDVQCVYSATLRKGRRPSGHRQGGSSRSCISTTTPPSSRNSSLELLEDLVPPFADSTFEALGMGSIFSAPVSVDMAGDIWPWEPALGFPEGDINPMMAGIPPEFLGQPQDQNCTAAAPSLSRQYGGLNPSEKAAELASSSLGSTEGSQNIADELAKLSELSVRLYPLYRSSSELMTNRGLMNIPNSLISDTIFESIAEWLAPGEPHVPHGLAAHPSSASSSYQTRSHTRRDVIEDTFCASRHLLGILRRLQSGQTPTGVSRPGSDSSAEFTHSTTAAAPTTSTTARHDTVICHLVLACHTLLLSTYITLFAALEHDADLQQGWNCFPTDATEVSAGTQADMRIVLVVQLSSYFFDRLSQAVEALLSSQPSPQQDRVYRRASLPSSGRPAAVRDLEIEVQQRLVRLRETLRI